MKAIDRRTNKLVDLLQLEFGNIYIQVDPCNQNDVKFVIDFLSNFVQKIKSKEKA